MTLGANGDFTFPGQAGAVGYIYTTPSGVAQGKTITLDYTVSGFGVVLPSPASGSGNAQVRLFIWLAGDDMQCDGQYQHYRLWAINGAGPLTVGQNKISAAINPALWSDCFGKLDSMPNPLPKLQGVGFTFGAEFYGHGVYSTGQNVFKINSFTVQ